jgi:hypothetical protein
MTKPPRAVGLILCRRMEIDTQSVEMSLVGLIPSLTFPTWPARCPAFMGYAALQGGEGQGTIELVVKQLDTEAEVHRYQRWIGFARPGGMLQLEIPLRRCVFPAPGRYSFELHFDGQYLTQRLLDVYNEGDLS